MLVVTIIYYNCTILFIQKLLPKKKREKIKNEIQQTKHK